MKILKTTSEIMRSKLNLVFLFVFCFSYLMAQTNGDKKLMLLRCDDIGMSHSVNLAAAELIKTGIPFSASVMFACPWYQEAVDILKETPHVAVGIHLTLNAEWKNYRWGPVSGKDAVPSLVDEFGFFFPSRAKLYENNPTLEDIEKELRAQIDRAQKSGIEITYLDYHMGTAVDKPEYRKIVEKLAGEYGLAISRYFGEVDSDMMYSDPIESKTDSLQKYMIKLKSDSLNLFVAHIAINNPEMQAMIDLNPFGLEKMGPHRHAELNALLSEVFRESLKRNNVELINYKDLVEKIGLENMKSPLEAHGYK